MAEPKRLRALLYIVELLNSMHGSRVWDDVAFEYPNPPRAALGDGEITAVNYYPSFWVVGRRGSELLQGEEQVTTVGTLIQAPDVFHCTVVGQFAGQNGVDAEVWLQRGYEDFRRTLLLHSSLGGVAREIIFGEYVPDAGGLAAQRLAEFEQQLRVIIDDRFIVAD